MRPAASLLIGFIAGILVTFAVDWFEMWLKVDDPGRSHSGARRGRIVGFACGRSVRPVFPGRISANGQWLAQVIGIATLLGFVLPLTYSLNWLLDRLYPQRVDPDGERQGMDLYELGAGAYPEFVIHTDEFIQR